MFGISSHKMDTKSEKPKTNKTPKAIATPQETTELFELVTILKYVEDKVQKPMWIGHKIEWNEIQTRLTNRVKSKLEAFLDVS
jgi:hypothetical protein